ncbi:phosphate ABC transporter permease PstA [Spirochaeta africana]|uniref:Phosphate transport system permease protein PstA n=1 Tax=Spirochaeta africana (strain ATCC 700263 / DSM 8902 / Z-7692) TaxID=889378 RepID=H9UGT9_SPIAZ|nr:phosphate ABC transporter permease PstA [Spirochaeta africana]AFG36732.1 phosphate ABC transporter, permease protein PstA [Spirochaeta africana DSM 8902]
MTLQTRYLRDRAVEGLIIFLTLLVIVPLFIIIVYVVVNGITALDWNFFTQELGSPSRAMQGRPTGLAHSIVGTIVIDLIALAMAIPFGIATGIMMSEYPEHPLSPITRLMTSTLNGMPAVLMGLLAFALVVKNTGGFSALAGSAALAFVMIPIIARSTESVLRITPWSLREVGLSLGLPRWKVIMSLVLPAARPGIVTGVLIAFARAAGEAAPLMLTSFGNNYFTLDVTRPMDTLPQRLYSLAISPYRQWHTMGWGAAIILMVFVITTFVIGRVVVMRMEDRMNRYNTPQS